MKGVRRNRICLAIMQGNLREYYVMPQESLREKLVGRIYGTRTDLEDGLLLCEIISAMACFSASAVLAFFPFSFLIFLYFLSSFFDDDMT